MQLVLASPEMLAQMLIEDINTITYVLKNNDVELAYLLKYNILTKYEGYEDYDIPVSFDETYINIFDSLKWLKSKLSFSFIKVSITLNITNKSNNLNNYGSDGGDGDPFKQKVAEAKKDINSIEDESKRKEALERIDELENIYYSREDKVCKYGRFKTVLNWLLHNRGLIDTFINLVTCIFTVLMFFS